MIIKEKKIHPFMIVQTVFIIACLVFVLTCPGNYVRNEAEIIKYFKDMSTLNFLDKLSLGLTSMMGLLVGKGNLIYTLFTFLIVVYIFLNNKEKLYRVVALIPFVSAITMRLLMYTSYVFFEYFGAFQELIVDEKSFMN